ncbi:MAG: PH domain-containing protein [Marinicaulis sp.]|nr:PH domain-containing protein [Marinicaulis sp.]NNL87674.1 PH domain-containing protein [Marinicaulis sp.]
MAYVRKTLAPGEDYVYRAKFNWTYDFGSWFWFLLGCVPAALWIFQYLKSYLQSDAVGGAFSILTVVAFLLGGIYLLRRYIHKWTTVIAVTSMRLILKTGLIARDTHEVSLDKIEEVLVHQSFLGRILGYGVLTVRGTGIAVIEFPILARPMEIRREIETAVVNARRSLHALAQQNGNDVEKSTFSNDDFAAAT